MIEKKLELEEALVIIKENLEKLNNEDVVDVILAWENNSFIEEQQRNQLLQDNKESNIEKVIDRLKKRYDEYVINYIIFLPAYKNNLINLDDDLHSIVDNLFIDFNLTNRISERELNRSQVKNISLDADLKQSILDYIDDQLIDIVEDDEDIESFKSGVFAALMVEMLYFTTRPLSLGDRKKYFATWEI